MEISAGILILYENMGLFAQPIQTKRHMWGIPKGKVEVNEDLATTASRETMEEVGIYIAPEKLKNHQKIVYKDSKTNSIYKKVYFYVYRIESLSEIGLHDIELPKSMLGEFEIVSAKFMTREEASKYIFWRQRKLLDLVG